MGRVKGSDRRVRFFVRPHGALKIGEDKELHIVLTEEGACRMALDIPPAVATAGVRDGPVAAMLRRRGPVWRGGESEQGPPLTGGGGKASEQPDVVGGMVP